MKEFEYWDECVSEALEDAGVSATDEQIKIIGSWVEGAHDNYGMATGDDVASENYRASIDRNYKEAIERVNKESRIEALQADKRLESAQSNWRYTRMCMEDKIRDLEKECK